MSELSYTLCQPTKRGARGAGPPLILRLLLLMCSLCVSRESEARGVQGHRLHMAAVLSKREHLRRMHVSQVCVLSVCVLCVCVCVCVFCESEE